MKNNKLDELNAQIRQRIIERIYELSEEEIKGLALGSICPSKSSQKNCKKNFSNCRNCWKKYFSDIAKADTSYADDISLAYDDYDTVRTNILEKHKENIYSDSCKKELSEVAQAVYYKLAKAKKKCDNKIKRV